MKEEEEGYGIFNLLLVKKEKVWEILWDLVIIDKIIYKFCWYLKFFCVGMCMDLYDFLMMM